MKNLCIDLTKLYFYHFEETCICICMLKYKHRNLMGSAKMSSKLMFPNGNNELIGCVNSCNFHYSPIYTHINPPYEIHVQNWMPLSSNLLLVQRDYFRKEINFGHVFHMTVLYGYIWVNLEFAYIYTPY